LTFEEEPEVEEEEEEEVEVEVEQETTAPSAVAMDLADHVAKQISSDSPLENLNELIVGRLRRKSVKKLFKKNEEEFIDFIGQINGLSTWKEASPIIDDEFYDRGINPYSKEAIALSDAIYMRFFPKDKYVGAEDNIEHF